MSPLAPIALTSLPADIRAGSADDRRRYQAGLAFERQLTSVLAEQLTKTAGSSLKGPYADLLPDALADALTAAGGLGLARQIAGLAEERRA